MFESKLNKGKVGGYAPLGQSGILSKDYLPPFVNVIGMRHITLP